MHVTTTVWAVSIGVLLAVLAIDLVIVSRRPHRPSMREAGAWVGFYVALAIGFGVAVGILWGRQYSGEFFAGWLTEYSLSLDNLFVFVIILSRFRVPPSAQRTVLLIGVVLALVLRGIFIALGAAVIARFSWIFYLFGAFLIWTAWGLATHTEEEEEFSENVLLRTVRRVVPTSPDFDGVHLRTRVDGRRMFTPMLVVLVAIGTTDLLFALDSIPAIFGLTQEPYLVFAANAFSLLGLRQLYFLIDGLLAKLVYLHYGLAAILGFIGIKLVIHALHTNELPFINGGEEWLAIPEPSIIVSLLWIIGVLTITVLASIGRNRKDAREDEARAQRPDPA